MNSRIKTFIAATALIMSTPAFAGSITTYSDRTTFTTAVGGSLVTETFGTTPVIPIAGGVLNNSNFGFIQPGVTYSTPVGSGNFFNIDAGGGFNSPFLDGFSPSDRDLTVTFDAATASFGFDTKEIAGETDFDIAISSSGRKAYLIDVANKYFEPAES